jgi:hypothetical protein
MPTYKPLTRRELISVIEGRSIAHRVPAMIHFWVHANTFGDREKAVLEIMSRYPLDVEFAYFCMPPGFRQQAPKEDATYSWLPYDDPYQGKQVPHDARVAISDWGRLDEIIEKFPDPDFPAMFGPAPAADGDKPKDRDDRPYRLGTWFFCLFERHWSLRGMTNALMDYYTNPKEVHRLFRALTDFYCRVIERAAKERRCDGIWTSDDLGTQTGPFFSVKIFREFFKPYYREMIDAAHANGMHFWMHACGDVTLFVPEWMEVGLDVLHPIQKHCMDERRIAATHGDRITILSGMDVQQVIPWGTPQQVRSEVRFLIDTFWRKGEGRCIISAGNGINQDCPLESLDAFLDETYSYGTRIVQQTQGKAKPR